MNPASNLDQLIRISSDPIASRLPQQISQTGGKFIPGDLGLLLNTKNGFLAFESALHIFASVDTDTAQGIPYWNGSRGWSIYDDLDLSGYTFFAQDIFGFPYAISDKGIVCKFDPESGLMKAHSGSLEEWAGVILEKYNYETGWQVVHEWQIKNHPIDFTYRLLPQKPFIIGGEFKAENMKAIPSSQVAITYFHLYKQVKDIPDGTSIEINDWI